MIAKKEEVKKEVEKKVEEKKKTTQVKLSQSYTDRLKKTMMSRIDKFPAESRDTLLARYEEAILKAIDSPRAQRSAILRARYEILLSVVQEEMDNIDDESLIDSLLKL